MNYIITNEQHYKDIATSIRERLKVDREYYPQDMAKAISLIPSSADGSNELVSGYYFYAPNENGYATKCKLVGLPQTALLNLKPYTEESYKYIEYFYIDNSCSVKELNNSYFPSGNPYLKEIKLNSKIAVLQNQTITGYSNLTTLNLPKTLSSCSNGSIVYCPKLEFVTIEEGFNCNNVNLSCSTKYSKETIVSWLKALKDRSGITNEATYKFIIGSENLKKLTAEEIKIATDKNWTIA